MVIKKDPTMSIRKHANEMKVHKKTVRIAIKQDLSSDLNPPWLHYMWCFRKQNMQLPIQKLVRLKLLLRRNGIKSLKNFEGMQIVLKKCWYNNLKNGSHIE